VTSLYLDVVSKAGRKALNHFNKVHKGELVAALVEDLPALVTPKALVDWGNNRGLQMDWESSRMLLKI
jgi:hypothetical protein